MEVATAEGVARRELATLPVRLAHVVAVADLASSVAHVVDDTDRPALVAAAWLHDIGYGPEFAETGFHPLDAARWLRDRGEHRLAGLVAHHTGAQYEAVSRGLKDELAEFEREESWVSDLLTWCDLNCGPTGKRVTPAERLSEVERRYGHDHVVPRSLARARPELLRICGRVDALLVQVK